jgi:F0F1-type ATP synthase assembly protein I
MSEPPVHPSRDTHDGSRASLPDAARGLQASFTRAGPVAAASYALIGAIVLLGGLGYMADRWLDTEPWLLVGGLLLGVVVGFYELARVVWRRGP